MTIKNTLNCDYVSLESQAEPTCTQQTREARKISICSFLHKQRGLKAEKSTSVTKGAVQHGFGKNVTQDFLFKGVLQQQKMGKELTAFSPVSPTAFSQSDKKIRPTESRNFKCT